jgi:hypothetical protein
MNLRQRMGCFIIGRAKHIAPNKRTRHHVYGVCLGVVLIFGGAHMAVEGPVLLSLLPIHVPHTLWEGIAYTLHGFGLIPLVGHGEKFYKRIMDPKEGTK